MDNSQHATVQRNPIGNALSVFFGLAAVGIGVMNLFWGNDPGYGIFIILLSLIFFPPINHYFTTRTGIRIPTYLKVLLALFIIWTAVGVGELFMKIDMMMEDIK